VRERGPPHTHTYSHRHSHVGMLSDTDSMLLNHKTGTCTRPEELVDVPHERRLPRQIPVDWGEGGGGGEADKRTHSHQWARHTGVGQLDLWAFFTQAILLHGATPGTRD
jgi:hypothetical protein